MLKRVAEEGLGDRILVDSAVTHDYHISDFERLDLILAIDHEHRRHLAKLIGPQQVGKLQLFMARAQGLPGREVPDPYYGGPSGFEHVLDLDETAIAGLIRNASVVPVTSRHK